MGDGDTERKTHKKRKHKKDKKKKSKNTKTQDDSAPSPTKTEPNTQTKDAPQLDPPAAAPIPSSSWGDVFAVASSVKPIPLGDDFKEEEPAEDGKVPYGSGNIGMVSQIAKDYLNESKPIVHNDEEVTTGEDMEDDTKQQGDDQPKENLEPKCEPASTEKSAKKKKKKKKKRKKSSSPTDKPSR